MQESPVELIVGAFTPSVLLATAVETGRLKTYGLRVTEVAVPSSPAQFRSLLDGKIDVAFTSPDNVVAYRFDPDNPLGTTADVRIVSAVDRGMGLGLYGRPERGAEQLPGATVGVDVPTSGFALAMYALAESLGVTREDYDVVALGSTPKRLRALLAGECDATMLNAGNELVAEEAGAVLLARVSQVCAPYLGTVLSVAGENHLDGARALSQALRKTAGDVSSGALDEVAARQATKLLGLTEQLAQRYVDRLKDPSEGLVLEEDVDLDALRTIIDLRRRYLPSVGGGEDVLKDVLAAESGLLADSSSRD